MRTLLSIPLYLTGECLIYVVTAGRRKPSWLLADGAEGALRDGLSMWIGLLFWAAVLALVAWARST
jgi:hypothetical protein